MTQIPSSSPIAGVVLPLVRAEELMGTLQSVVSARIVAGETGAVEAIHVLVTGELTPKQVVRNIESALIAHLGMTVDHRKISVATSIARANAAPSQPMTPAVALVATRGSVGRAIYFEDVEFRGSRTKGSACRVTLRRGEESWVGEAEGMESSRSRAELAARASLAAIRQFDLSKRALELVGVKRVEAFDTAFVLVAVETWIGRERALMTGSCEIRESAEVSAALAVLDATNRWLEQPAE
jgi:hypothetical protein